MLLCPNSPQTSSQSRQEVLRTYCPNIYCDIHRQGRSSSILMNKTCTNDLLKVFVIHGQDNSWLTWNINAQWKNLHILFNNHKLSCTLSAALGVKTSAYFLNRKMPIKVKFKSFFFWPLNHMILYLRHIHNVKLQVLKRVIFRNSTFCQKVTVHKDRKSPS